jgi:hypothetical protein
MPQWDVLSRKKRRRHQKKFPAVENNFSRQEIYIFCLGNKYSNSRDYSFRNPDLS